MRTGPLWCVAVTTTPEAEDAVSEILLSCFSQCPSSYLDAESGRVTVAVYLDRKPNGFANTLREGLRHIRRSGLETGPCTVVLRKLHGRDWAESWKRHFHPLEIGAQLLIKPGWSRRKARRGQALVVLDPGLSFGTGQHPTTLFCLREIAAFRNPALKQSLLDIGTGSGILAIAGAKLKYSGVRGLDFEPTSVRIARANARRNGVQNRVRIEREDVQRLPMRPDRRYDVVCANLTADLLVTECARIAACVNRGGLLVLAGILRNEFHQVTRVWRNAGFKLIATRVEKEWQGGAFVRRSGMEASAGNRGSRLRQRA